MTIGIGVLCSTKPSPHTLRPDALVMIADTMGSTDTDSTQDLHKLYCMPDERIYAVCADQVEIAAEVIPLIRAEFAAISGPRTHGSIWRALSKAAYLHRSEHFLHDVVAPKYMFVLNQLHGDDRDRVLRDWESYNVGAQLLVGTFDDEGRALLYLLANYEGIPGLVHAIAFPGYGTIGTGFYNANFWLNYRRQRLGMNIKQSACHVYEASQMASAAPTVNDKPDVLVATRDQGFHFSHKEPPGAGCPLSFAEMVSMAEKHAPKNTDDLGFPKVRASTA